MLNFNTSIVGFTVVKQVEAETGLKDFNTSIVGFTASPSVYESVSYSISILV